MPRHGSGRWAAWLGLLLLAGCNRTEPYLEVYKEQRQAWNDLADVLETIKDEKSMKSAAHDLDDRLERHKAGPRGQGHDHS